MTDSCRSTSVSRTDVAGLLREQYQTDPDPRVGRNLAALDARVIRWDVQRPRVAGTCLETTAVVTWRTSWWPGLQRHRLDVALVAHRDGWRVSSLRATPGSSLPVWLHGDLHAARTPDGQGIVVALAGGATVADARRVAHLRRQVLATLIHPPRPRPLVVVTAPTTRRMLSLLGPDHAPVTPGSAVTVPADGSREGTVTALVLVDRRTLAARGPSSAFVLRHEAVHALTGAPASRAPAWVVEGYADDVALRATGTPAQAYLRRVLDRTRATGVPAWPTPHDFRIRRRQADAYARALVAVRCVAAEAGGPSALDRFAARTVAVGHEHGARRALRAGLSVIGLDRDRLLSCYRRALRKLTHG